MVTASAQPNPSDDATVQVRKTGRHRWKSNAVPATSETLSGRFDQVVKQAALTPAKLASLFESAKVNATKSATASAKELRMPAPERFASLSPKINQPPLLALAYADPLPNGATAAALAALTTAVSPIKNGAAASEESGYGIDYDVAALPDYEDTPSSSPLPLRRPRLGQVGKPAPDADEPTAPKEQKLAYARPDDPTKEKAGAGLGHALRNLFNRPKAGNGVAVYDISAAKVYMPDGSVLEAHSGIGKMADNPRYAHIKMNGPTPPHTYNLKMREKRFHGVEAIRMLPVDGKNKHGRDGFLAHSYLLRGGRAESHGCVAFKDYGRFLAAFKKGKVKQLVVVPGGGRSNVHIASNGNRA
jgi:hypothetical protein